MSSDEKTAWDILLLNRLNPAHWVFIRFYSSEIIIAQFKNKITGDKIEIHRNVLEPKKGLGRLYENKNNQVFSRSC